jgi:hypothetical protein
MAEVPHSRWILAALFVAAVAISLSPGPLQPSYSPRFDPESPRQGQTVRLSLRDVPPWIPFECRYGARSIPVEKLPGGERRVLLPIAGDASGSPPVVLTALGPRGWRREFPLSVLPGGFPSSTIHLSKDVYALFEDSAAAKANQKLRAAFAEYTLEQHWTGTFSFPVPGRETTPFGARRLMQGELKYFHKGIDIAAPKGAVVRAANNGIVRIAEPLPLQGNVVVLDHGLGVDTVYQHLSAILVKPGRRVFKGEALGLVGSTGISTGPHLHWSLFVHGVAVDPAEWVRRVF